MPLNLLETVRDRLTDAREHWSKSVVAQAADPPLRRSAMHYAQQAAEDALKAYLTLRERPFDHSHQLPIFLHACVELDSRFEAVIGAAEELLPCDARDRSSSPLYSRQVRAEMVARVAAEQAGRVLDFVEARELLPYATRRRYPPPPGSRQIPEAVEVCEASEHARCVLDFVVALVPPKARP